VLSEVWGNVNLTLAETMRLKFISLLEETLATNKPYGVENVSVSEVRFGNAPPIFKEVSGDKPPHTDFQLVFDMTYGGPAVVILDVLLGTTHLQISIPFSVQDLHITARVRVDLTFFPKSPYLHTLSYCFTEAPLLEFSIRPLKLFDLMELPYLNDWIEKSVKNLVMETMVKPEMISISYQELFATEKEHPPVSVNFENVRQEDVTRHHTEVEKSKKDGDYGGLLHVKIVQGKKFQFEFMGVDATPYIIVSTGPHEVFTTKNVKRSKTPVWNEFFELLVKKQREKKMEVTVMARDMVNERDVFIGMAELDFGSFNAETRDVWISVQRQNKKGETVDAGDVHLQVRYVLPIEAEATEEKK